MLSWLRSFVLWLTGTNRKRCEELDYSLFDCEIRQFSDQEVCVTCGKVWDMGDANPCNLIIIQRTNVA